MLQAAAIAGLFAAALYLRLSLFPSVTGLLQRVGVSRRASIRPAKLPPSRPNYPYSVIPGGAYSAAELQAALLRDPVAARHYAGFRRSMVRMTESSLSQPVYLSYRIADAVYWTSRPVRLPQGETLLTDGEHYARARCGNRISEAPKTPVNDTEPAPETLNTPQRPANMVAGVERWTENRLLPAPLTITPSNGLPLTVSAVIGPVNEIQNTPSWWLFTGPSGFLDLPVVAAVPRNLFPGTPVPVIQPNPVPGYTIPPTPTGYTPLTPPSPPSPPVAVLIPPDIPPGIWPPTVPNIPDIPLIPIGPGSPTPTESVPEPGVLAPLIVLFSGFALTRRRRKS
ncbi:MAG TPA: PEP-CTERM sorting domain-containing protein [Bryobacteraceae bacterium]|jgi:hypothetical protein|nr:PEP-CTERM sorting domain-containing protein [Bryobacteraceae bacterium]